MITGLLGMAACTAPAPDGATVQARVRAFELELAQEPLRWGPGVRDDRLRPTGGYLEDKTWWSFSATNRRQVGLDVESLAPVGTRRGPLGTRACVVAGPFGTVCAGFLEGVWQVDRGAPLADLPVRGGFTDVAWTGESLLVVDTVEARLLTLRPDEPVRDRPLWPGVQRVRPLDDGRLLVLADQSPVVAVLSTNGEIRPLRTAVPVRDAVVDSARGMVWTVGPAPRPLRRDQGFLEGLYSTIEGTPLEAPRPDRPTRVLDLRAKRLVDGVSLAVVGESLAVAAAGSNGVWIVHPDTRHDVVVPTVQGPRDVAVRGDRLFVPGRLDDRLLVVDVGTSLLEPPGPDAVRTHSVQLAPLPTVAGDPVAIGERLFSQRALWSDDSRNDFTCDSCHWDGLTDHRVHPGFLEQRREATRPALGMRGIVPVFSPMQSPTLTDAVEGFVSALDVRYWTEHDRRPILAPVDLPVPGPDGLSNLRLSPEEVRRALVAYLMTAAPAKGPVPPDSPLARRGLELFRRDCVRCHEPTRDLRTRELLDVATALREGPLVFGAPLFARSGVEPTMTRAGTRISPLVALHRGGPYFTDGSARTLRDVVDRSDPRRPRVHGAAKPHYPPEERDALVTFLWTL